MAKPNYIELGRGAAMVRIAILYEDRSILAIDKPAGWMLVPFSWQRTSRNLQAAIVSSIAAGDFWARSRSLKFLKYVHRLDAETTGVMLFAKSHGAVESFGELFESRRMEKTYLAVAQGRPKETEWACRVKLSPDPKEPGRMKPDPRDGKDAETHFRLLQSHTGASGKALSLIEARPVTGRMHQIRVHLTASGLPILGDEQYGRRESSAPHSVAADTRRRIPSDDSSSPSAASHRPLQNKVERPPFPIGLRAVSLSYHDPFTSRRITITARATAFLRAFGFDEDA